MIDITTSQWPFGAEEVANQIAAPWILIGVEAPLCHTNTHTCEDFSFVIQGKLFCGVYLHDIIKYQTVNFKKSLKKKLT